MIKKYCDRCVKDMGIVYSPPIYNYCASSNTTIDTGSEEETMNIWIGHFPDKTRTVDLCEECYRKVYEFIFEKEDFK